MILSILVSAVFYLLLTTIFILISKFRLRKLEKRFNYEVDKTNLYKTMVLNRNKYMLLKLEGYFKKNPELKKYVEKTNLILSKVGTEFNLNCLIHQTAKNDKEEEKRIKILMKELVSCAPEVKELINNYNSASREIIRLRFPSIYRNFLVKLIYMKFKFNFFYKPILYVYFCYEALKGHFRNEKNVLETTNGFKIEASDIIKVWDFSSKIGATLQR